MGETSLKIKKLGHMEGVSSFADGDVIYGVKENRTVQVPKSVFLADDRKSFNQLKDSFDSLSGDNTEFLKAYDQYKRGTDHEIGYGCIRKAFNSYVYTGEITQFEEKVADGTNPDNVKYKTAWIHLPYPEYRYTVVPTGGARKGDKLLVKGYFFQGGTDLSVMNPGKAYDIGITVGAQYSENSGAWHANGFHLGRPDLVAGKPRFVVVSSMEVRIGQCATSETDATIKDGVHILYYNYRPNDTSITSVKFIVNVNRSGGMTPQSFSDWAYPPTVKDWYHYDTTDKAYPDTNYSITESQYNDLVAKGLILN